MDTPERIRTVRMVRALTQVQLAMAMGMSPATLSLWETGQKAPTTEQMTALREALHWTPDIDEWLDSLPEHDNHAVGAAS